MSASSLIGAFKTEVDTPALLVDLDVMEANIGRVA
jgi:D-serine deaminase-like pyridoxal phosphate-dependent protein